MQLAEQGGCLGPHIDMLIAERTNQEISCGFIPLSLDLIAQCSNCSSSDLRMLGACGLAQCFRGLRANKSKPPTGQAQLHRTAFGVDQDTQECINGFRAQCSHSSHGRPLNHRIRVMQKGLQQDWQSLWIFDQREGLGGSTPHRDIVVAVKGLAKGWHGCFANDTEAFGEGESHQTTPVAQARHHSFDAAAVGIRHLSTPELVLELHRQLAGLLFAQLEGLPADRRALAVIHGCWLAGGSIIKFHWQPLKVVVTHGIGMTCFVLSHNLQVQETGVPPFNAAVLAAGLKAHASGIVSAEPLDHPHWLIRIESELAPADLAVDLIQAWRGFRRACGHTDGHQLLALGGRKDSPSSAGSPLTLGAWGVDVVETMDGPTFLRAIGWEALKQGRPADAVFAMQG